MRIFLRSPTLRLLKGFTATFNNEWRVRHCDPIDELMYLLPSLVMAFKHS